MMIAYSQLSLRYKLPIAFGMTIIVTALIISGVLSWHTYRQMRDDLIANAEGISKTLARSVAPLMLRDDVWQAFESIVTPLTAAPSEKRSHKLVVVLDKEQKIFVSSQPRQFPMQRPLAEIDAQYAPVLARLDAAGTVTWYEETGPLAGHIFVASPIQAEDGLPLGTVIVRYADSLFLDRFGDARERVAWAVLATVLMLLPLGWLFSKRLADPLVSLRKRMATLPGHVDGPGNPARSRFGGDEIRDLSDQFDRMTSELAKNEVLKTQIAAADRLAAIGRLAAGIAHEINNPLGGMINAVNTFERYGQSDALTGKTTSLLKRGLAQIKETVGAMLVEARLESRAFTPEDVEDLKTLTAAHQKTKCVSVEWDSNIADPLPLPATPLRQLVLNLLLNAVAASDADSPVTCSLRREEGMLAIRVSNSGNVISGERMLKLFEPYEAEDSPGNGLGLWVCYQIVRQLNGTISVFSQDRRTEFAVEVPVEHEINLAGAES
jgi:two-component system NtrC family sensor kinase